MYALTYLHMYVHDTYKFSINFHQPKFLQKQQTTYPQINNKKEDAIYKSLYHI